MKNIFLGCFSSDKSIKDESEGGCNEKDPHPGNELTS
jgi:hypothetical protein